jgi:hypothetical protein
MEYLYEEQKKISKNVNIENTKQILQTTFDLFIDDIYSNIFSEKLEKSETQKFIYSTLLYIKNDPESNKLYTQLT